VQQLLLLPPLQRLLLQLPPPLLQSPSLLRWLECDDGWWLRIGAGSGPY